MVMVKVKDGGDGFIGISSGGCGVLIVLLLFMVVVVVVLLFSVYLKYCSVL